MCVYLPLAICRRVQVVLSEWQDLLPMIAVLKSIYTNDTHLTLADLRAVLVSSCSSSHYSDLGTISAPQAMPGTATSATAAALPCLAAPCTTCAAAAASQLAALQSPCWQELCVRVLRLADQYSIPGATQAAIDKLAGFFSGPLNWPAVLGILWLPGAVAEQPALQKFREMAVHRVVQVREGQRVTADWATVIADWTTVKTCPPKGA